jgi:hypothetical protein
MYDPSMLRGKLAEYREVLQWNVENAFLPKMTPEERRKLGPFSLEIPLAGDEGLPFEYYAHDGTVFMPALSIKFLGDLAVSHAWLAAHGNITAPLFDYLSMLRYGADSSVGGRFPDPRTALGIPADATSDSKIEARSQQMFNQALSFILLHEMAHVLYRHPGYDGIPLAEAQDNESAADAFALEVLRRTGTPGFGALFWFAFAAYLNPHAADFETDPTLRKTAAANSTHPMNSVRAQRVVAFIREHASDFSRLESDPVSATQLTIDTADQIESLVLPVLSDARVQRLIRQRGAAMTLQALRSGRQAPDAPSASRRAAEGGAFTGSFAGTIDDGKTELACSAQLHRTGRKVSGHYDYGTGPGTITGAVSGDVLELVWRSGTLTGHARLRASVDGWDGTWGYDESHDDGGHWRMKRD